MAFVSDGTRGNRHWTVEFGGTQGWIASAWTPHPQLEWVQTAKAGEPIREVVLRDLADLDALMAALTSARAAIAAKEQELARLAAAALEEQRR